MRAVRVAMFAFFTAAVPTAAFAQYGLYGSPETLPATAAYPSTGAATAYASPAVSVAQQPFYATPSPYAPTTAYQAPVMYQAPQQAPGYAAPAAMYPARAAYRYPAQAAPAAAYQPYQSGSQYRYPGPAVNQPMRVASAKPTQAIPAPPAAPAVAPYASGQMAAPSYIPTPQPMSVTDQMITEQENCGVFRGDVNRFEQAACGPSCGDDVCCGMSCCPWYTSVQAMVVGRSGGRRIWTSSLGSDEAIQLGNTSFPIGWRWGGEVKLGRRFSYCCTPYALEASFWTSDPFSDSQTITAPAGDTLGSPLNANNVQYTIGSLILPAEDVFVGARSSTVIRRSEFYDGEINLVREQLAWAADSPWDIGWSVGVRYFRFQDSLSIGAEKDIGGTLCDVYFKDTIANNLVGVQFGFDAAYNVCNGLRFFVTPKVGIYDNIVNGTFVSQGRAGGGAYVNGDVTIPGYGDFPVTGSANGIACLTQVDMGADWQINPNWSIRGGYRVLAISGVALADDQFSQMLCDTPDMSNPQYGNSLVIHGAFVGATYNY